MTIDSSDRTWVQGLVDRIHEMRASKTTPSVLRFFGEQAEQFVRRDLSSDKLDDPEIRAALLLFRHAADDVVEGS